MTSSSPLSVAPFERRYGVLVPHFGSEVSRRAILDTAHAIEGYGFDSVWARDHLVYQPHPYEDPDRTFVDPFVTLATIAAVTERVTLATGTVIPHRNPVHLAVLIDSLEIVAGPGRVLIGVGLGTARERFDVAGMADWDRREVIEELVGILRKLRHPGPQAHLGKYYSWDAVDIRSRDAAPLPIWYAGSSLAAGRRAVEYCDGWIPARMPRHVLRGRMARLQTLAAQHARRLPEVGIITPVSPARTVEEAVAFIDLPERLAEANKRYGPSPSYSALADLDGAVIAGPPSIIVEEVLRYHDAGATHFVFDLRDRLADWDECLAALGEEVLPALRAAALEPARPSREAEGGVSAAAADGN